MKFETGDLVEWQPHDQWIGRCIALRGKRNKRGKTRYEVWSLKISERLEIKEEFLSPVHPQGAKSEV